MSAPLRYGKMLLRAEFAAICLSASGKKAVSLFGEAAFGFYTALYFFVFFVWFTDFKCRCELLFGKSGVYNIA